MDRPHYLEALRRTNILSTLAPFNPCVVGTPPLGLDRPDSDIDIICFAPDADAFACAIWSAFGAHPAFRMWQKTGQDRPIVATFADAGWMIELFGQASPITDQFGWRHFVVERRLLALGGEVLRAAVMARRADGMKTEPAFATLLGLDGDPYLALLDLQSWTDMALVTLLRARGLG